jgi:hypothetical protein
VNIISFSEINTFIVLLTSTGMEPQDLLLLCVLGGVHKAKFPDTQDLQFYQPCSCLADTED